MNKIPLNLTHLKYFLDAVKQGSITASAKINHVSQSAISQGITRLEERFGCHLLAHQPKRFKVTDEGLKLFENSKRFFRCLKRPKILSQRTRKRRLNLPARIALRSLNCPITSSWRKGASQRFVSNAVSAMLTALWNG